MASRVRPMKMHRIREATSITMPLNARRQSYNGVTMAL
jgi:hypothetical protein